MQVLGEAVNPRKVLLCARAHDTPDVQPLFRRFLETPNQLKHNNSTACPLQVPEVIHRNADRPQPQKGL